MKSNKKGYAYKVMAYLLAIIIFLILIKIFVWPIIPRMVEPFLVWLGVEAGFEIELSQVPEPEKPAESSIIVQYSSRSSDGGVATNIFNEMPNNWDTNLKPTELWSDITSENPNDVIIVGGSWKNNLNRDKCGNKEGGSEEIYIGYYKEDAINIYCVAGNSAQDTIDSGNYLIMKYLQNGILPPDRELNFKTIRPEKWSVTDSSRYDIDGSGQITSDGNRDTNEVYNYIMGNEYKMGNGNPCYNPDDSLCPFTFIEFQEANGKRFNDNEIIIIPYRMTN